MLSHLFVAACIFIVGSCYTIDDCPSHLHRHQYLKVFGDKCYRFLVNTKKDFEDAQDYCRRYGGELALAKSESINEFIRSTVRSYKYHSLNYATVWIGLRHDNGEDVFKWEDGSALTYRNFEDRYSTLKDNCGYLKVNTGKWSTHDCKAYNERYAKHYFICEYPIKVSNEKESDCPKSRTRDKYLQTHGHKCYRFAVKKSQYKTFRNAQSDCEENGGNLVTIRNAEENDYINNQLKTKYHLYHNAWIGLRYDNDANDYRWVDGSLLGENYDNFKRVGYDDCVVMAKYGTWQVEDCGDHHSRSYHHHHSYYNKKPYICEYSQVVATTTTTTTNVPITTMTPQQSTRPVTDTTTQVPEMSTAGISVDHTTFKLFTKSTIKNKGHTNPIATTPTPAPSTSTLTPTTTPATSTLTPTTTPTTSTLTPTTTPSTSTLTPTTTPTTSTLTPTTTPSTSTLTPTTTPSTSTLTPTRSSTTSTLTLTSTITPTTSTLTSTPTASTLTTTPTTSTLTTTPTATTPTLSTTTTITTTTPAPPATRPMTDFRTPQDPESSTTGKNIATSEYTTDAADRTIFKLFSTPTATNENRTIDQTNPTTKMTIASTPTTENRTKDQTKPDTPMTMTTTPSQTTKAMPRHRTTCPSIICELDCGLKGYSQDERTGCVVCRCED